MTMVIKNSNNVDNNKIIIKEYNNSHGHVTKANGSLLQVT